MTKLILHTNREGYATNQCRKSMTVAELVSVLQGYDENSEIYLAFDNGYTFGSVQEFNFDEIDDE